MTCTRRARGQTEYRCWSATCPGCRKTYKLVAARIVDDLLAEHPNLRTVWWLAVDRDERDDLADYWIRLYNRLRYHEKMPDRWLWFVFETSDECVRYLLTDRSIATDWLDRYWVRYGGRPADVFDRSRKELRRDVLAHCGEIAADFGGRRMGSAESLPGVSPRRHSAGRVTPPRNEIAYRTDVPAD